MQLQRTKDIFDGGEVENIGPSFMMPVRMDCVNSEEVSDSFREMQWQIGKNSGFIQLKKLVDPELLYHTSHFVPLGDIWKEHNRQLSQLIYQFRPSKILEIGGGSGALSYEYIENLSSQTDWLIVEPYPIPLIGVKAKYIESFFTADIEIAMDPDIIVHSHVWEHMYNPKQFLKDVIKKLPVGGLHVFSIPNMKEMLARGYTNCLNFEHTVFLREEYIDSMLSELGFSTVEKRNYLDDHSIFYVTKKLSEPVLDKSPTVSLYSENRHLFSQFIDRLEMTVAELNLQMSYTPTGTDFFLFGAHIFSQYLIAMGLNTSKIAAILDNNPLKQGKRLYGTSLYVTSPEVLRFINTPTVILKAGAYDQEIRDGIIRNINQATRFL